MTIFWSEEHYQKATNAGSVQMSSRKTRAFIFLFLMFLILSMRVPFLSQIFVGEEGAFAALIASSVPSSDVTANKMPQMLIGVIKATPIYSPFERNITPYILLQDTVGSAIRGLDLSKWGAQELTILVRVAYFSFFLLGVSGLVWMSSTSVLHATTMYFLLGTPLILGASIQPQIDGSTGVLLVGVASFLYINCSSGRAGLYFSFLAGFLIALGRHELALAFGAAVIAVIALLVVQRMTVTVKLPIFFSGLLVGVLFAFCVSPADYIMGFGTMSRVYDLKNSIIRTLYYQFGFIWPVFVFAILIFVLFFRRRKDLFRDNPELLVIFLGGVAVAAGFAISGWSGDGFPRYYAPSLIALGYALIGFWRLHPIFSKWFRQILVFSFGVGVVWEVSILYNSFREGVSVTSSPGTSLVELATQMQKTADAARVQQGVYMEPAGMWLYHPGVDFLSLDLGLEGAKTILKERNAGELARFRP